MKIVGEDGSPVANGDYGEIVIHGPNVMPGYLDNEATADDDPRRLAAHGRHRLRRRRRLLLHRRPHQGHDHPRRREHLPAGDRGGHLPARGRAGVAVIGLPDEIRGEEVLAVVAPAPATSWTPSSCRLRRPAAGEVQVAGEDRAARRAAQDANRQDLQGPLREEFGSWAPAGPSLDGRGSLSRRCRRSNGPRGDDPAAAGSYAGAAGPGRSRRRWPRC